MTISTAIDRPYTLDMSGFLVNPADWSPAVAEELARREGLELTEAHWTVIKILRNHHAENRVVPMIRDLLRQIGVRLGNEKANNHYLYSLFPCGPLMQALKLAGLPMPCGCN
ncbi:MAG: TusE/DsrC/DsvC family sulfur relay protein [Magnetococcales bacterium]|nr:TusE/DsrC/DsvC family sulfur relay protein [Magnetococcales bacterium]